MSFADATAGFSRAIDEELNVQICRITIDTPSDPKESIWPRLQAEQALDARQINCITTPCATNFCITRQKSAAHLASGRLESRIPDANRLWMLVGFALFARLKCLEIFPQATPVL
ncbi:MAG: hypothetical protein ACLFUU_10610 [Desulfobacteraceae bacterium]